MLEIFFGLIVGLALGLTGGGGSIFAIPLLVYGLGLSPQEAITISLATVTLVALTGALSAAKNRMIEYRVGAIFAILGFLGAPLGIVIANGLNDQLLLIAFSGLMAIVAVAMWMKATSSPDTTMIVRATLGQNGPDASGPPCRYSPESTRLRLSTPCSAMLGLVGSLTGILSGLFGVGGGFIIVPALTTITQLSIQRAVTTSLFVITIVGASGFTAALASKRELDLHVAGLFLLGGILGMITGQKVGRRITGPTLQKTFAVLMIAVAAITLLETAAF
jgi:hypothetical protein